MPEAAAPLQGILKRVSAIVADDQGLVRAGLVAMLRNLGVDILAEARTGPEALALAGRHDPDLVLLDVVLPEINGIETIRLLRRQQPKTHILVVSLLATPEYVRAALHMGADGYLLKHAEPHELEQALNAVMRGERYVSPEAGADLADGTPKLSGPRRQLADITDRQREVLQLVAEGHSSADIARTLGISLKTVETHRTNLMERLGIHDVAGLVRFAIRAGVVSLEP